MLQRRSRRWAGGSGASSAPEAPATRFAAATSRSCRPVGPPGQHPSTSRPGDPHWFRSSSSIGTRERGPGRSSTEGPEPPWDEQACGRAILCKGSTFGFHSTGKLHAGAVGHRRRAGRCAVLRLPGTEERSPAPRARPGRSSTEGPEPPRVLRPYGRSTLCTTVCSLSAGGQVHAGAVGHQRRAGRCAMQPLPWPRSAHRLLRPTPCAETQQWARHAHSLAGGETGNMTARPHWQAASQGVRRHTTVGVVPCPSISTNKKKRRPHR